MDLTPGGSLQLEQIGNKLLYVHNAGHGIGYIKATQAVIYMLLLHYSIML